MSPMIRTLVTLAGIAALVASCTSKKQDAPPLSGPSELATSIAMTASPDQLRQDGASQSQIGVLARDSSGQPVRNLSIRFEVAVNGIVTDYGQLSSKTVVTGSDGRATALYTAPSAPVDPVDEGTVVQVLATPIGTDYGNATARSVSIRLVPPGVILPPNGTPTPQFVVSPSAPMTQSDITFDGSLSRDNDGQIVTYTWNFGDGTSGSGQTVKHRYAQGGSYSVTLTVTDDRGLSASVSSTISVSDTATPTADFAFSPTSPIVGDTVFFNAAASRAATGRTLVSYEWTLGTGRTATGVTVSQSYGSPGSYSVTLTVTDDVGKSGTTTKVVPVSVVGAPTADFSFSPTNPVVDERVYFNAAASRAAAGRRIVAYDWTLGTGHEASGVTTDHYYRSPGSYTVTLTVTDDVGTKASASKTVPVAASSLPTAIFSFSPTNPGPTEIIQFNGSASTGPRAIIAYEWDFGDGTTATGMTTTHGYAASCPGGVNDRTFVVRLTVRDNDSRTGTTTQNVVVTGCR